MTDYERLLLFYKLFPLLKITPGQLVQARVYQDGNQYVLVYDNTNGTTSRIVVDFISQVWYVWPLPSANPYMLHLDQAQADKFFQELLHMLTAQPLIVNGINQNATPLELQPFTDYDWEIWAGSDKPADGEPVINYDVKITGFGEDFDVAVVIMDARGIYIQLNNQDVINQSERCYEIEAPWPMGWKIISQLSEPLTPAMLSNAGFGQVS